MRHLSCDYEKRGQVQFAGTARRVLRTNWTCPLFSIALAILYLAIFGATARSAEKAADKAAEKPNIVLILVDDLGWMDLHCQGNARLDTPNIDRLAAGGMRFTDAYAAAPVCSPTRAAILTGLSPARLQLTTHIPDRDGFAPKDAKLRSAETLDFLPARHVTIAERLKAAGYATAFMGKWHLAGRSKKQGLGDERYYPEQQGFDINLGGCALGGPPSFFAPFKIHNLKDRKEGEYLPYRLIDEAEDFLSKNRDRPFFLALWHYTVHWPMQAPEKLVEKYRKRVGPGIKDPRYAAMIEALDNSAGRLLATLDKLKLTKRTLVIFASDNGGYMGVADNRPLRLGKGYLYEGGIRVPLIVSRPGVVKTGVNSTPVISTDFYPTILAAAGLKPDADKTVEGENLLPLLNKTGQLKRDALYFHYPNYAWHGRNRLGSAIRQGRYKLIENFDDGSIELYDLKSDLSESRDLAQKMPKTAGQLRDKLRAWRKATGAPLPPSPSR